MIAVLALLLGIGSLNAPSIRAQSSVLRSQGNASPIENARLYRASVRATQLRDQVLGVVVHDLRNPLSNILLQWL